MKHIDGNVVLNSNNPPMVRAPDKVHTKGSGKRIKSGKEEQRMNKRTCHSCSTLGHNVRTCPNLK